MKRGKHGYKTYQKYNEGWNAISKMKNLWEADKNNEWLTEADRATRKAAAASEAKKAVEQIAEDIKVMAWDSNKRAFDKFYDRLMGESDKVAKQAQIMGAQYAQMSDDQLLQVLESKFDNSGERGLLLSYLNARVEAKPKPKPTGGLQPIGDPLKDKIQDIIGKNVDKMQGTDEEYLYSWRKTQAAEEFAEAASTALKLEYKHAIGELNNSSTELVQRREALNKCDGYINSEEPFVDNQ